MPKENTYFPPAIELSSLNGNNGFRINGLVTSDWFGWSVGSAGNFNNDTFNDIIIGAMAKNGYFGATYVIYGNRTLGGNGIFDLSLLDGKNGITFNAVAAELTAYSVGNIDANADGVSDITIGAPGALSNAGRIYVVYGGKNIGASSGVVSLSGFNGNNGFTADGSSTDNTGFSVAGCDFNGDGYNDLVVGAFYASPLGRTYAGITYVAYSRTSIGNGGSMSLSSLDGTTGFKVYGSDVGDYTGYSVGCTNINNDQFSDVVIGSSYANPGGKTWAGKTHTIFGYSGSGSSTLDLITINNPAFLRYNGALAGDRYGTSVINKIADVNGDGIPDQVVGAFQASPGGKSQAGSVIVVFGPKNGTTIELSNGNIFSINGASAGDQAGISLAIVDLNGDNINDIVIGAFGASPNGRTNAGAVYLVFGGPSITTNGVLDLSAIDGINLIRLNGVSAGDYTGGSLSNAGYNTGSIAALPDINGDGIDDIIIGAHKASPGGRSQAGSSYILYGDASPKWDDLSNTIDMPDCGSVLLNIRNFNATDKNHNATSFIYDVAASNGYFAYAGSTTPISSFNYSSLINNQVVAVSACNHMPFNHSAGVHTPGFAYLPLQPGKNTFIRTFTPSVTANQLKIARGKTVVVGLSNFNGASVYSASGLQDPLNLWSNFTNLNHITYTNGALNNATVNAARRRDIQNGVIYARHDGTANAPTGSMTITDDVGLNPGFQSTNYTFVDKPYLNFTPPFLKQYGNVRLTSLHIASTCDDSCNQNPANAQYTYNGPGAFAARYPNLVAPISTFTKQEILSAPPNGIYLVSDGSANQPVGNVNAYDVINQLHSGVSSALVPFLDAPHLANNQVPSVKNRILPVSQTQLYAAQQYGLVPADQLTFMSNCTSGDFYSFLQGATTYSFANANITNGDIGFSTGNTDANCTVILSDGSVVSLQIPIVFAVNSGPKFGNIDLTIRQGEPNKILQLSDLKLNTIGNPLDYLFEMLNPQYHTYRLNGILNPQNCTIYDIAQQRLSYFQDGSTSAPIVTYKITDTGVGSPTYGLSDTKLIQMGLIKKPQIVSNGFVPIYQAGIGSSYAITTTILDSTCDGLCSNTSSALQYSMSVSFISVTHPDLTTLFNTFTKQDQLNGQVYLASTGTNNLPAITYNITDTINSDASYTLKSGPYSILVPLRDMPYAPTTPFIGLDQKSRVVVTRNNIFYRDNTNNPDNLDICFPFSNNGVFSSNATGSHVNFVPPFCVKQGNITRNFLHYADDNTAIPGVFGVQASNQWLPSPVQSVTVDLHIKNPAPTKINSFLSVQQSNTPFAIRTGDISFQTNDIGTTFNQIKIKVNPGVVGGYFQSVFNKGTPIFEFTQGQIVTQEIEFVPDGTEPSFTITAYNNANVPNVEGPIVFSTSTPNLKFVPSNVPPTVDSCSFVLTEGVLTQVTNDMLAISSQYASADKQLVSITNRQHIDFFSDASGTMKPLLDPVGFSKGNVTRGNIWAQQDNTFNTHTFYIAASTNGNKGSAQPCYTQTIFVNKPAINDKDAVGTIVQGGELFITDAIIKAHVENPIDNPNIYVNIIQTESAPACNFKYQYAPDKPLSGFYQSDINRQLFLKHNGDRTDDGNPKDCRFNISYSIYNFTTGPFTSSILTTPLQIAPISGGNTFSLISGNSTALGIAIPVVLLFGGLALKLGCPKLVDKCLEIEVNDPLELEIMKNMNKRLTLRTPRSCFYMFEDKREQYCEAIGDVIWEMSSIGIQTDTIPEDAAGCCDSGCGCCSKDTKKLEAASRTANIMEDDKSCMDEYCGCCSAKAKKAAMRAKRDSHIKKRKESLRANGDASTLSGGNGVLEDSHNPRVTRVNDQLPLNDIEVRKLARKVVTVMKAVCIPKRSSCTRCCQRYCCCVEGPSCKRDIEEDTIKAKAKEIAQAVKKEITILGCPLVTTYYASVTHYDNDVTQVDFGSNNKDLKIFLADLKDVDVQDSDVKSFRLSYKWVVNISTTLFNQKLKDLECLKISAEKRVDGAAPTESSALFSIASSPSSAASEHAPLLAISPMRQQHVPIQADTKSSLEMSAIHAVVHELAPPPPPPAADDHDHHPVVTTFSAAGNRVAAAQVQPTTYGVLPVGRMQVNNHAAHSA